MPPAEFVKRIGGTPTPAVTALLAVMAELADSPGVQARCREEVAARGHYVPRWIRDLPLVEAYRAVRAAHVLGDFDEIAIGVRIGRYELSGVVAVDHVDPLMMNDVQCWPVSLDEVLPQDPDQDVDLIELSVADVRAWISHGLKARLWLRKSEPPRAERRLMRWLCTRLPEGGTGPEDQTWDDEAKWVLSTQFFATEGGAAFRGPDYPMVLENLMDSSPGDPLRWSEGRIEHVLQDPTYDVEVQLDVALSAPDLLRAFIPFAHVRAGIRDELTLKALAGVDRCAPRYRSQVLRDAADQGYFDDAAG